MCEIAFRLYWLVLAANSSFSFAPYALTLWIIISYVIIFVSSWILERKSKHVLQTMEQSLLNMIAIDLYFTKPTAIIVNILKLLDVILPACLLVYLKEFEFDLLPMAVLPGFLLFLITIVLFFNVFKHGDYIDGRKKDVKRLFARKRFDILTIMVRKKEVKELTRDQVKALGISIQELLDHAPMDMDFKASELKALSFTLEEIHAIKKSNGDPVYNANRVLECGWKKEDLINAKYKGYR